MIEIVKDKTNKSTVTADWCKESVPSLARFNKVFVRRRGKGFARNILLSSTDKEDIDFCFEKESTYFKANGWDCILTNEKLETNDRTLLFRTKSNGSDEVCNTFDIKGVSKSENEQETFAEFIDMVGFIDLPAEFLKRVDESCRNYLLARIKEKGMEYFVNKVVMSHYDRTESDYVTREDMIMMFGTANVINGHSSKEHASSNPSNPEKTKSNRNISGQELKDVSYKTEPVIENKVETKPASAAISFDGDTDNVPISKSRETQDGKGHNAYQHDEKINSHSLSTSKEFLKKGKTFRPVTPVNKAKEETLVKAQTKEATPEAKPALPDENSETTFNSTNRTEITESKSAEETIDITAANEEQVDDSLDIPVPAPAPTKTKKISFQSKEKLSDAEKRMNEELLHNIRSKYEEISQFIRDMHSPQYTTIINLLTDALNTNKYTKQMCPKYLEISDDISSVLYAKLYELDQVTAEFNKKLIRQTYHLGCAFCAKEWDEDITFIDTGMHYTRCPNCGNERPFVKEN